MGSCCISKQETKLLETQKTNKQPGLKLISSSIESNVITSEENQIDVQQINELQQCSDKLHNLLCAELPDDILIVQVLSEVDDTKQLILQYEQNYGGLLDTLKERLEIDTVTLATSLLEQRTTFMSRCLHECCESQEFGFATVLVLLGAIDDAKATFLQMYQEDLIEYLQKQPSTLLNAWLNRKIRSSPPVECAESLREADEQQVSETLASLSTENYKLVAKEYKKLTGNSLTEDLEKRPEVNKIELLFASQFLGNVEKGLKLLLEKLQGEELVAFSVLYFRKYGDASRSFKKDLQRDDLPQPIMQLWGLL